MSSERPFQALNCVTSIILVLAISFSLSTAKASGAILDAKAIAEASGSKTSTVKGGVIKIGWSRSDVAVTIDGEQFPPAAGLGSWAAFTTMSNGAMVMGDTVVFEDEVDAAMDAAFSHGLEVTALHNHFFYSNPPVFFMHIEGEGDPNKLAKGVRAIWDAIRTVRTKHPQPVTHFAGGTVKPGLLNEKAIEKAVGLPASVNSGVVKVTVSRTANMHGTAIGGSMGVSTWAAFVGRDRLASMDGDFVMTAKDAQVVFRALRKSHIHIVAIHTHMMGETPTLYFMHFWGKGSALELARGFKAALDAQASVNGT